MEMKIVPNTYISDDDLIQKFTCYEYYKKGLSAEEEDTLMF
ncbi:hypothetical protein QWZ06_24805 [Chryseobacterium tructae]|uniref:Uncharacterized protein n=1 Tax=Chryseobacterium tructae TaxID=1037380 RepID=A0ABV7XRW6_9FLAO|nr:hypothetical protein [Chryseobacterium tructae]MDN3695221.1 hypothetical protein [Chryseobacterium tructae]